jgi:hypothetical protein
MASEHADGVLSESLDAFIERFRSELSSRWRLLRRQRATCGNSRCCARRERGGDEKEQAAVKLDREGGVATRN